MSKYGFPLICALMAILITGCFPKDDNKLRNEITAERETESGDSSTTTPDTGDEDEDEDEEEEEDPNEGEILVQPATLPKRSDCITIPDESNPNYAGDVSALAAERRDVGWIKSFLKDEALETDTKQACFLNPTSVGRELKDYVIGVEAGQTFALNFTTTLKDRWLDIAAYKLNKKFTTVPTDGPAIDPTITEAFVKANPTRVQWFFENRTAGVTTISGLTPGLNTNTLKLTAKLEKGEAVRMEVLFRWDDDPELTPLGSGTTGDNPLYLYIFKMTKN